MRFFVRCEILEHVLIKQFVLFWYGIFFLKDLLLFWGQKNPPCVRRVGTKKLDQSNSPNQKLVMALADGPSGSMGTQG